MRLSITSKLFIAVLVTNVVIAAAFGIANQISVNRGFREFVQQREQRRVADLAEDLGTTYVEQGRAWDFVRGDEDAWRRLTQRALRRPPPPRAPYVERRPGEDDKHGLPHERMPPPPRGGDGPGGQPAFGPGAHPLHPHGEKDGPGPGPGPGVPGSLPPPPAVPVQYSLLDADKQRLAGPPPPPPSDESILQPIVVQGDTVGWIAAQGPQFAGSDQQFLKQQLRSSWMIAALAVLIAAAVSIFLARGFLAPIRRLARATHRLAEGDYSQRVAPSSRDELGQLVSDFNGLAATLENLETSRRAFLADVSHELRTPLAVLRAELEALQDGVRSLTPAAVRSLQAEVATLGALVDDLYELALADLGEAVYHKVPLDLAAVARTALQAFAARFQERRLEVEVTVQAIGDEPVIIEGDERRLTQLFNNLLENTIRYTDPDGRVGVAISKSDGYAILDLQDSAPGVPEAALPRVFERLFRVESSRNRERGGAGLGLSLCRSIVAGHGGDIEARPSALGGLWIRVRLPLAEGS